MRSQLSVDDLKTRGYIFRRLPNTATEVRNIAALFPPTATIRTGADASKLELLQTDLGRFKFVHFATHGFFPVEPGIREPHWFSPMTERMRAGCCSHSLKFCN